MIPRTPGETPALPWSAAAERAAVAGFWLLLAALEVLRQVQDPFRVLWPTSRPTAALFIGVAAYAAWAVLTPGVFWLTRRYPLEGGGAGRRVLVYLGLGLPLAVLVDLLNFSLLMSVMDRPNLWPGGPALPDFTFGSVTLRLGFLDDYLVYLAVLAVGIGRNTLIRLRERDREAVALRAEATDLQGQLAEARLSALRMQLNPHFLFNTLNTVSALADESPEGVQRVVARLSTLLRRTLDGAPREEVALADELQFLRDYLDIQRVRFQDRLTVVEEVAPETLDALVPNLILQPLVENAIKHGSERLARGGGRIVLRARPDPATGRLVLEVEDNGPGLGAAPATGAGGVGLANTRARLDALYGDGAGFELVAAEGGGVRAVVTLPFHTAADLRHAADA